MEYTIVKYGAIRNVKKHGCQHYKLQIAHDAALNLFSLYFFLIIFMLSSLSHHKTRILGTEISAAATD